MNFNRMMIVLAVAGLVGVTLMNAPQEQEAQQTQVWPKSAVAVVDLDKVFKESKEAQVLNAEMQKQLEEMNANIRAGNDELKELQGKADFYVDKSSPGYAKAVETLEKKAIELQALNDFQKRKAVRMQSVHIELLYKHVQEAIRAVARANGIDVVLFNEQAMDLPKGATPDALMARIAQRKVLYAGDNLDITDQVIQDMNNRYTNN